MQILKIREGGCPSKPKGLEPGNRHRYPKPTAHQCFRFAANDAISTAARNEDTSHISQSQPRPRITRSIIVATLGFWLPVGQQTKGAMAKVRLLADHRHLPPCVCFVDITAGSNSHASRYACTYIRICVCAGRLCTYEGHSVIDELWSALFARVTPLPFPFPHDALFLGHRVS